jgi:hypothetical protein
MGIFDSLRKLAPLLQEFCFFKLESIGPTSGTKEAYGLGTKQIQVGDVMIPLWSPELRPDHHSSLLIQEEIAIHISTMLIVRPIREQSPKHSTGIPNGRERAKRGRIIGSAVGVFIERDWNHDCGLSVYTKLEGCTSRNQQCSMRLI